MASFSGKRIPVKRSRVDGSVISSRASSESSIISKGKQAACDASYVGKKLLKSTGKAAWIAATTFLIIGLPLILSWEREQLLFEFEVQHQTLLGSSPGPPPQQAYGPPM